MQLQHTFVKDALKPVLFAHIPFFVDDSEGQFFIGCACLETDDQCVGLALDVLQVELGCLHLVVEVGIEDVELVALDCLGWRIVSVIVSLVVFVPFEAGFHGVEIARFPWPESVILAGVSVGILRLEGCIRELLLVLPKTLGFEMIVHLESQSAVILLGPLVLNKPYVLGDVQ